MPIKFVPNHSIDLNDYNLELDYEGLGIDNVFISMTKYIQVEANQIIFLNENKKVLGEVDFESEKRAINFFNFTVYMIGYKVIFKDKFAVKDG